MPIVVRDIVTSAFVDALLESNVDLTFDEIVAAMLPFDLEAVQRSVDTRLAFRRSVAEASDKRTAERQVRSEELLHTIALRRLARQYAGIIMEMRQSRAITESTSAAARIALKARGRGCDVYPC